MGAWFSYFAQFLSMPIGTIDGNAITLGGSAAVLLVATVALGIAAAALRAAASRS